MRALDTNLIVSGSAVTLTDGRKATVVTVSHDREHREFAVCATADDPNVWRDPDGIATVDRFGYGD
jgi:hypothetical protein